MITPHLNKVRFSDCDMMGHVNNAVYFSYFEDARIHYFNQIIQKKWDWKKNGVILKKNEITYHSPLFLNDVFETKIQLDSIGNKSFSISYKLTKETILVATGCSILIRYNYNTNTTICIDEEWKNILQQLKTDE